jgi:NADH dehydrogenase FAD-containing subunit
VIVGASFAGRMIAEELLKLDKKYKFIQIIMIDKKNHFECNPNMFKFLAEPENEQDEFLNNVMPFNAITDTFNDRIT